MKKIIALVVVCLLGLNGFSQFSFYEILPMGVSDRTLGDTVLNTHAILKREGIRKITAIETSSRRRKGTSFTTIYLINKGHIEARYWCYRPSPDTAFSFCTSDTLLYNNKGQLQEFWVRDNKDTIHLKMMIERHSDANTSFIWITKDPSKPAPDTSIVHHAYNAKGQLINQQYGPNAVYNFNASLYYNPDGLPDSIRHENPAWGTYVFSRKQKGGNTVITLERANTNYKWVYNAKGQCIASEYRDKYSRRMPNGNREKLFSEVEYFYNSNGTLSKVVEKTHHNNKSTTVYSYESEW